MLRVIIRLGCVAAVASLPIPLDARSEGPCPHPEWARDSWRASHEARLGPEQEEKSSQSFRVGPSGTLELAGVSGDVTVTEGGTDTITVEAVKKVHGLESDARAQFARVQVTMTEHAGRVEVRTGYSGHDNHVSVDFAVTAPAGTTVSVHTVSGDVKITGIRGEVRAESVSGNISAMGTPLVSLVKSVSGDIVVTGVATQDDLHASTVSGDISVKTARMRGVDADTVSGEINLVDVTCERATAGSTSGSIAFSGPLARSGRYELKAHSGDVRVALSGDPGFELDARTFSGSVRSDVPVTTRPGETISLRGPQKGLRGVHGDGSAQLVLTSFSGDITIVKR